MQKEFSSDYIYSLTAHGISLLLVFAYVCLVVTIIITFLSYYRLSHISITLHKRETQLLTIIGRFNHSEITK